jgi:hypothetical protein
MLEAPDPARGAGAPPAAAGGAGAAAADGGAGGTADGADADADAPAPPAPAPCDVCSGPPHKYRCPGCGVRSCGLACVRAHKDASGCSGRRDRLAFVPLSEFGDRELMSGAAGVGCKRLTGGWGPRSEGFAPCGGAPGCPRAAPAARPAGGPDARL